MLPIIVIVGPTAVGKTKLSIALAKHYNGEIINGDSMQVYRGLSIGTAKVTLEEQEGITHHLLDICDPEDFYTVYDYQKDARKKIEEIEARGHVPIIVGGTGLYIKAALYNYEFQDEEKVECNLDDEELYAFVKEHDKDSSIHPHNRKRLERAYAKIVNQSFHHQKKDEALYSFITIGLTTDRELLYEKINQRVDKMFKDGLEEEVYALYQKGIHSKAIETGIGYKELYAYFAGNITKEEAINLIKKNSRHYAKKQYTFFKHQFETNWVTTNYENFQETINETVKIIDEKTKRG